MPIPTLPVEGQGEVFWANKDALQVNASSMRSGLRFDMVKGDWSVNEVAKFEDIPRSYAAVFKLSFSATAALAPSCSPTNSMISASPQAGHSPIPAGSPAVRLFHNISVSPDLGRYGFGAIGG